MNTSKCPVCGNPGIPDYLNNDVVCPHCGSDLKIYRTLSVASNGETSSKSKTRRYRLLAILLPIVVLILSVAALGFYAKDIKKSYASELSLKDSEITALKDSISALKTVAIENVKAELSNYSDYTVVRNDGPWSIVRKNFGYRADWSAVYAQIAKDNGIWDNESGTAKTIHPGQILKINKSL